MPFLKYKPGLQQTLLHKYGETFKLGMEDVTLYPYHSAAIFH